MITSVHLNTGWRNGKDGELFINHHGNKMSLHAASACLVLLKLPSFADNFH